MNKRTLITAVASLFLAGNTFAQDNTKHASDSDDAMTEMNNSTTVHKCCHSQILAIAPMQFTENGVGLSLSYEKALDKAGIIAFNIPVIATFNLSNNNHGYYGNNNYTNKQDAMYYCSPGLKFYPTGSYGKVRYALGPSLVVGLGEKTDYYDYYNQYPYNNYASSTQTTYTKFILGVMVTNSLNINPTEHFYLGLDLGLGFSYINTLNGVTQPMSGLVQGGFKVGYRF